MYYCDLSWIFSIITPVFSVTWSFSIIINHQTFIVIIKVMLLNIFVETVTHFYSICFNYKCKIQFLCLLINLMHLCWIRYYFWLIKGLIGPKLGNTFICLFVYIFRVWLFCNNVHKLCVNILCVYTVISIHLHHSQYFIVFLWLSGRALR